MLKRDVGFAERDIAVLKRQNASQDARIKELETALLEHIQNTTRLAGQVERLAVHVVGEYQ